MIRPMMSRVLPPLLLVSLSAVASESKNLERLNFFPNAKAWAMIKIQNETVEVETPEQAVQTKKINNFTNTLALDYAYRVHKKVFVGICATYEAASENALRYGVALRERFQSQGIREPDLFVLTRLRDQGKHEGLIDFYASYSKSFGAREIGNDEAHQRYNGRNIFKASLSHGKKEDEWEFKTLLSFIHNGKGEEINHYDNQTYNLHTSQNYEFHFMAQYQVKERLYGYASIGVAYRGDEGIKARNTHELREIQAGTGSVFTLGTKYSLSEWTLLQFEIYYMRSEYFVKGTSNLDGTATIGRGALSMVQAF